MKVLLAIDSSTASQYVISTAATRPWPSGTVFCVVNVVDVRQYDGMPVLIEEEEHQARLLAKGAMEALIKFGYEVFSEVHLGFPTKAVPEYANEWGADLVMVGAHGRNAVARFFLGRFAQAVLRSSPCSVEIVRRDPAPRSPFDGMKILLATDGSEFSCKALCSIANRPWPAKTQIRILSVVELPMVQANPLPEYSEYPNTVFESACKEVRMHAKQAVANAREMLSAAGLSVCDREATPEGDPRSVVLDLAEAWEEDLIVLGSHGKQGWDRLLIGSVAESVALQAHCSVEIIRR